MFVGDYFSFWYQRRFVVASSLRPLDEIRSFTYYTTTIIRWGCRGCEKHKKCG